MRTLATALLASIALVAVAMPVTGAEPTPAAGSPAMQFGMDAAAISAQASAGVPADYGTFWIGPWTLSSGWGGPDAQLASLKAAGVTPAIHFYYWGDDISPSCVENGCWSSLHNAWKDQAGWDKLATQMTAHLNTKMGGEPAVVFLESEFNKGGISTYEPFDADLQAMAQKIHAEYPAAIVVLGFGNWDSGNWKTFDRAAAASDMVGVQGMRGSTRQSQTDMYTLYDGLLAGVKTLESTFPGKAIMLTDVAVSSYPEPGYVQVQADVLAEVFANLATLQSHGVTAMVYRSWKDSPNMDTANYYGEAERHWGLAWPDGTQKAAGKVWAEGVKAQREAHSNQAPAAAFTASVAGLSGTFDASASSDPDGDALSYAWSFGDGASGSGQAATHAYAAPGSYTVTLTVGDGQLVASASRTVSAVQPNRAPAAAFSATASQLTVAVDASGSTDADGDALSYAWSFGDGASGTGKAASHAYAAAGTYAIGLTVSDGKTTGTASKSVTVSKPASTSTTTTSAPAPAPAFTATVAPKGNEWWVEAAVSGSQPVAKVEAKAGSGSWVPLDKKDWGAYAKSFNVPKGTLVQFRVTAADGQVATTSAQAWLVDMSLKQASVGSSATTTTTTSATTTTTASKTTTTTASSTSTTSTSFRASFTPKAVGNDWWVESAVTGNQPIAKVEAKVNGGSWVTLSKQDWGNYAKSLNAPNGSSVVFKATSTAGAQYSSVAYTWT